MKTESEQGAITFDHILTGIVQIECVNGREGLERVQEGVAECLRDTKEEAEGPHGDQCDRAELAVWRALHLYLSVRIREVQDRANREAARREDTGRAGTSSTPTTDPHAQNIYAHWGMTRDEVRARAIHHFERLLEEDRKERSFPQDGSKGQAEAWHQTLITSLQEEE